MNSQLQWQAPLGCHGCGGKGWVDTHIGVQICPICKGTGIAQITIESTISNEEVKDE